MEEQIALFQQNREERKKYANHIFKFTCCWAAAIFVLLLLSSLKLKVIQDVVDFQISDKVLIALITTTTANSFGFFYIVVKYLFNTGDDDEKKKALLKKGALKKVEKKEIR